MNPTPTAGRAAARGVRIAGVIPLLSIALSGCMPASTFRAPSPMLGGQSNELGFGLSAGGFAELKGTSPQSNDRLAELDLWYYHQFGDRFDLGGRLYGGVGLVRNDITSSRTRILDGNFGMGITLRGTVVKRDWLRLGVDLNGGLAYAQLSIPLALRAHPRVWVYTSPGFAVFGNGDVGAGFDLGFPIGVWIRATRYLGVMGELTTHVLGPQVVLINGSVGAAFRF